MPRKSTLERAEQHRREGKAASTQAGEFVREEIEHVREGKHGAASTKQVIAIGLSKARRAGVRLAPPREGEASAETRSRAKRDVERGARKGKPRSRAATRALRRESGKAASRAALSKQAKSAARKRGSAARKSAARKAARTRAARAGARRKG
jgi:hypothetical protein